MPAIQTSIRIQEANYKEIKKIAAESGKDFSVITNELLEEAVKMKRCPGIVFADGVTGRRARIAGTGIEVWEIISDYKGMNESIDSLREAYHWLSEIQFRAALAYYKLYPDEINTRIERDERLTPETITERYPFLKEPGV